MLESDLRKMKAWSAGRSRRRLLKEAKSISPETWREALVGRVLVKLALVETGVDNGRALFVEREIDSGEDDPYGSAERFRKAGAVGDLDCWERRLPATRQAVLGRLATKLHGLSNERLQYLEQQLDEDLRGYVLLLGGRLDADPSAMLKAPRVPVRPNVEGGAA